MKKIVVLIFALGMFLFSIEGVYCQGVYVGPQVGYSSQKPILKDVEFSYDTTFLFGARAGIKVFMIALEVNYFQAAHNLELTELITFSWGDRKIDYNYLGLNLKYFFPILIVHPYLTFGYGYYTADILDIGEDSSRGFNLGFGIEIQLGKRFSLLAEGKYHHARFDIAEEELKLKDFTFGGGFKFYF